MFLMLSRRIAPPNKALGLLASLMALSLLGLPVAHAVEGSGNYVIRHRQNPILSVEVIEGDQIVQQPEYKNNYTEASISAAPLPLPTLTLNLPALIGSYNRSMDPASVGQITRTIQILSDYYHLDARLLASLVAVESSFNPAAISRTGAIGLGQLKPDTARWLGVADPFDPVQNLVGVAKYMRYLLDRFGGSAPHALAAYYQGQGTIDKRGIDTDATYYISKVSRVYNRN